MCLCHAGLVEDLSAFFSCLRRRTLTAVSSAMASMAANLLVVPSPLRRRPSRRVRRGSIAKRVNPSEPSHAASVPTHAGLETWRAPGVVSKSNHPSGAVTATSDPTVTSPGDRHAVGVGHLPQELRSRWSGPSPPLRDTCAIHAGRAAANQQQGDEDGAPAHWPWRARVRLRDGAPWP